MFCVSSVFIFFTRAGVPGFTAAFLFVTWNDLFLFISKGIHFVHAETPLWSMFNTFVKISHFNQVFAWTRNEGHWTHKSSKSSGTNQYPTSDHWCIVSKLKLGYTNHLFYQYRKKRKLFFCTDAYEFLRVRVSVLWYSY